MRDADYKACIVFSREEENLALREIRGRNFTPENLHGQKYLSGSCRLLLSSVINRIFDAGDATCIDDVFVAISRSTIARAKVLFYLRIRGSIPTEDAASFFVPKIIPVCVLDILPRSKHNPYKLSSVWGSLFEYWLRYSGSLDDWDMYVRHIFRYLSKTVYSCRMRISMQLYLLKLDLKFYGIFLHVVSDENGVEYFQWRRGKIIIGGKKL
jgi:hypothetical protein